MPGKQPSTVPEYMNHIAGYTLREVGELQSEYKRRLFRLAVEKYREDYGESPEWYLLQARPQPTIQEELGNAANIKLRRIRER